MSITNVASALWLIDISDITSFRRNTDYSFKNYCYTHIPQIYIHYTHTAAMNVCLHFISTFVFKWPISMNYTLIVGFFCVSVCYAWEMFFAPFSIASDSITNSIYGLLEYRTEELVDRDKNNLPKLMRTNEGGKTNDLKKSTSSNEFFKYEKRFCPKNK